MSKETIELLDNIAQHIGSDWKEDVMIDDTRDLNIIEAYNEGVKAMASQVCHYLLCIINANGGGNSVS